MKKYIITFLGALTCSMAFGQFTYGPKVGGNMSRFNNDNLMPGIQAGGFLGTDLMDRIGIQVDFLWTLKGNRHIEGDKDPTTTTTYYRFVDVPICIYFPISKHIRGFAGPQISVFRQAHQSVEYKGKTTESNLTGEGKRSFCFGFDLNMDSPLVFGVRFLTNKFNQSGGGDDGERKLNSVMLNVAYKMDW